jgi:transposase InsO family protein
MLFIHVNKITVSALLDSGASRSCVSESFLQRIKQLPLKRIEINTTCQGINSSSFSVSHKIKLDVKIGELSWKQYFLVLPKSPVDVILGADFMTRTGMIIDFKKQTYSFAFKPNLINAMIDRTSDDVPGNPEEKSCHLNNGQRKELHDLLGMYGDVITESLGCTDIMEYNILLTDRTPVRSPPYQCNPVKMVEMRENVQKLLQNNVIAESNSPYASPAFLVPKKGSLSRLVVDYRALNRKVVFDAFPLPTIENALMHFGRAKVFSVLDLNAAYHQIPLTKESRQVTAFITPFGLYEYNRLPFGICTGGQILSRLVDRIFGDIKYKYVFNYLDDVVVYSENFDDHLQHLKEVFCRLRKAKLTVNPAKISLAVTQIKYLGHIITSQGIRIDPERAQVIDNFPVPKNLKSLKRFLGMCSFYARFIPCFSEISAPLNQLKKKNSPFVWGRAQQKSFEKLKSKIASPPVLRVPDFNKEFVVHTDASSNGVAGVLSQREGDSLVPVAFASRTLSDAERKYTTYEAECLAVIFAVEKFDQYLRSKKFELHTDNEALSWMRSHPKQLGKVGRWLLRLSPYKFSTTHVRSSENVVADCLSRMFEEDPQFEVETSDSPIGVLLDTPIAFTSILEHQRKDTECRDLIYRLNQGENLRNLKMHRNLLVFRRGKGKGNRIYVPKEIRRMLMAYFHDSGVGAHLGYRKSKEKISREFYWPNMHQEILAYVKSCPECQRAKPAQNTQVGYHSADVASKPWEKIFIDFMGPLTRTRSGHTVILAVLDAFSKFVITIPMRSMTARATVQCLSNRVFAITGFPKILVSDNASVFTAKEFKSMCFNWGIKHVTTSPYYPKPSHVERFNRNLKAALTAYHHKSQGTWDENLHLLTIAFNSAQHESTQCTPSSLFLGRELNHPLSVRWGIDEDITQPISDKKLEEKWESALRCLKHANKRVAARYNKNRISQPFHVGQTVVYKTHPVSSAPNKISGKLLPKWSDPHKIIRFTSPVTVELGDSVNETPRRRCHVSQIKAYHER